MDEFKIECSVCGEELTPFIQKRITPIIESLVKMRLANPEIRDIKIQRSKVNLACPKCDTWGVYPVDLDALAEARLEEMR